MSLSTKNHLKKNTVELLKFLAIFLLGLFMLYVFIDEGSVAKSSYLNILFLLASIAFTVGGAIASFLSLKEIIGNLFK